MSVLCMHHYMRTNYLLLGTVGWRPSPLSLNKVIIITYVELKLINQTHDSPYHAQCKIVMHYIKSYCIPSRNR